MGFLSSHKFENLKDLFVHQLSDLYDAENRIIDSLPKMVEAASEPQLKQAFRTHLAETQRQVQRLEQIFQSLSIEPKRETCPAMKGIIAEAAEMIEAKGDADVRDAALIASAQRVEHYEIAGYGTLRTFARQLGYDQAVTLLQQTLDEESATDKKLTALAESSVNVHAAT